MTTSLLNDILLLKDRPAVELKAYLQSINVTIFDSLYNTESPLDFEPKNAILYIVCAYSEDSPLIILRQDDKAEKENICEYLQIPEIYRPVLTTLNNHEIRHAVTEYLEQFAGPLFRGYMFNRIQAADLERNITNRDFGEKGEDQKFHWDIPEQGKAQALLNKLYANIHKFETEIRNQVKLMAGIKDMHSWMNDKKKKKSVGPSRRGGVEFSTYIK